MNAKQARKYLLEHSQKIVDDQIYFARNSKTLTPGQKQLFGTLSDMMVQEGDVQKLNTGSTGEVVKLMGKGKISIQEGIQLMELLRTQQEVDLAPELLKQLTKLNKRK